MRFVLPFLLFQASTILHANPFNECKSIIERDHPYLVAQSQKEACSLIREREEQIDSEGERIEDGSEDIETIENEFKERNNVDSINERNWSQFREFAKVRSFDVPKNYNVFWGNGIRFKFPEMDSKEKFLERVCWELGDLMASLHGAGEGTSSLPECDQFRFQKLDDCPRFYREYLLVLNEAGKDAINILKKDYFEIFPKAVEQIGFQGKCYQEKLQKDISNENYDNQPKKENVQSEIKAPDIKEVKTINTFSLKRYGPFLLIIFYFFPGLAETSFLFSYPILNWLLGIIPVLTILIYLLVKKR